MRLRFLTWLPLCVGLLVSGCEKAETDTGGRDNSVVALTLSVGEQRYLGAIQGDIITLTVPEGISLEQAVAEVTLSERATMMPDPAQITNWDEDLRFMVTSATGTMQTYTYTIVRQPLQVAGNVTLTTQAEVDAFALSGASIIEGNLVIGQTVGKTAADTITSLEGLLGLKEVRYNLTIHPTYGGTELTGLKNLTQVGGLRMGAVKSLLTCALPALTAVGTELNITSPNTTSIELPALTRVGETLQLTSDSVTRISLDALETVGGALTLKSSNKNVTKALSVPVLQTVGGLFTINQWPNLVRLSLPQLTQSNGITLSSLPKIAEITLPQLESSRGKISLTYCNLMTRVSMPKLTATSDLSLTDCGNVTSIDFSALSQVSGKLEIKALKINDLNGLRSLTHVGTYSLYDIPVDRIDVRSMEVDRLELFGSNMTNTLVGNDLFAGYLYLNDAGNKSVLGMPPMEGFSTIGSLEIYNAQTMTSLIIPHIQHVRATLKLTSGAKIQTLQMPDLVSTGSLEINYMNALANLELPLLESISGNLLWNVTSSTLSAVSLPSLQSVGGNFTLNTASYKGTTLDFPNLSRIDGALLISASSWTKNATLTSVDGLQALRSVKSVTITFQDKLVSFAGLSNCLGLLDASTWKISNCGYNPTFDDMQAGEHVKP